MERLMRNINYHKNDALGNVDTELAKSILNEIDNLNIEELVEHYRKEMSINYDIWFDRFESKFKDTELKIRHIIFEYSCPSEEDESAFGFGYDSKNASINENDDRGKVDTFSYIERFDGFGKITIKGLNPLIKIYKNINRDDLFEDILYIDMAYGYINAHIFIYAIEQDFYKSKFATLCDKPFSIDIQEHDSWFKPYGSFMCFYGGEYAFSDIKYYGKYLLEQDIETLIQNIQNNYSELNDEIYVIRFNISSQSLILTLENEIEVNNSVQKAIEFNQRWINFELTEGKKSNAEWYQKQVFDKYNTKADNFLYNETIETYSLPYESSDLIEKNHQIMDDIENIFRNNLEKLKSLKLHKDCEIILMSEYYFVKKIKIGS